MSEQCSPGDGVVAAGTALARGETTAMVLVNASIARIDQIDPMLHCFVHNAFDRARALAAESDHRRARGAPRSELDGIPFAVKDNFHVANMPTTNGLGLAMNPGQSALAVERLLAAGAVLLGKLNMHEAALGATTDNPHHGATQNPLRPGHTPGGSSGASAAAVAAGLVPFALGSDTMGSVRLPAAYCGVVGYKPSRHHARALAQGMVALHSDFDCAGVLARSVEDALRVARVLTEGEVVADPIPDSAMLKLGRPDSRALGLVDDGVAGAFERACEHIQRHTPALKAIDVADVVNGKARRAGLLLIEQQANEHLAWWLASDPASLSPELRKMLEYGRNASADKLDAAHATVAHTADELLEVLQEVDALIAPTAPQCAFAFDSPTPPDQADWTAAANFAGCPAISLPIPVASGRMPVGLQVIGRPREDSQILALARLLATVLD